MRPHYEFFDKITSVFRLSGRSVPYFNDNELSWRRDWSKKMVDVSRELGSALQSGSSLAVTRPLPSVEFPLGASVEEALSIGYGPMTSYDFHDLETIRCMIERRKGGESGIEWIQTYRKNAFWKAYEEGVWLPALVTAALSRSSPPPRRPDLHRPVAVSHRAHAAHHRPPGRRRSQRQEGPKLETPNLAAVQYQPNPKSTFWRS